MTARFCSTPVVLALASCLFAAARPVSAQRLPTNVKPQHYTLHLTPDIAAASFTGSETLDVTLAAPSASIVLNSAELKISSVTSGGQTGTVTYDPANEQATFTFPRPLPAGKASLAVEYTGILNDKLRGFYLSKTRTRSYAVSQFEATDARRAFPSFDEPALKATFDVSLTVDTGDMAISNTNVISDVPAGTKHTFTFATTPRMSTYLVAFLVGDFQCVSGSADAVPIRVCSTPDKIKLTPFALSAAEHFLSYYDTYFGIKYPMPKLDLIAIPDFEAGAMENFGAITYRETELLVDDKDGSIGGKKRVASTVAHEMAHQWFGDMVTMQWWDNLWLNEGFATWMQDKAAGEWHPEWHFPQDVADELDGTLNLDAAKTTRPIRATANTPAQIQEMFDGISYGKAGAVIGMVEQYVGPEVFRQGVHNYLAAHLYANATAEDFWNAQTATSKQPVNKIMSSFVEKPGVPLLTFGNKEEAGYPVHQSRFFLGGHTTDQLLENDVAVGWTIPVCQKTSSAPSCTLIPRDVTVLAPAPNAPFFFPDAGDKGYYRISYTPEQLKTITAQAETGLTIPERASYLGDRWALTRAGMEKVGSYLDLAFALKTDANPLILGSALDSISTIRSHIATPEEKTQLNAILRQQLNPVWVSYAKPPAGVDEPYEHQQIRAQLFQALGAADDPAIIAESKAIVNELLTGKKLDDDGLIDASVVVAAANGDAEFYDRLKLVSQKATDPGLQTESLETLAEFRRPELVLSTLQYATSGEVRNQDSWVLIAIELSQPQTRDIAWPWVQAHWDSVKAQLTTGSGSQFVSSLGSFCTVEGRNQVEAFFKTHQVEAADRALTKALDSIDDCVRLHKAQEPNLREWLAAHPA